MLYMKKKFVTGILTLAMAVGMSSSAYADDIKRVQEIEPNFSFAKATNFTIVDYVILDGEMSSDSDFDYFRFQAPKTGTFSIDCGILQDVPAGDLEVLLYSKTGAVLKSKKLNSRNELRFEYQLTKDEVYYIGVESMYSKPFEYTIDFEAK
ncbi:hypothetical protein MH117_05305 [Paenibacillus sp. ACRRX]|uniref:hypothetical protein n=1 Tax=unclassified Paenibacillus TaxID=185978 RepID=UPI001EF6CECB|nr:MULTISPECIES: hypothetical protein [unclassified Paenibacillus]MCG7406828.1 hypothetical protein [Paenibacillus sp. ACRRX]MDK8179759.1 hypothetical protein [Paenibacillus sp. UMB4589-SE434]